jgi:hypothetical protein
MVIIDGRVGVAAERMISALQKPPTQAGRPETAWLPGAAIPARQSTPMN